MPFDAAPELPVTAEPKTKIGKALLAGLAALGPNGEWWCKSKLTDLNGRVCAMGALGVGFGVNRELMQLRGLNDILGPEKHRQFWKASDYLDRAVWQNACLFRGPSIVSYNDSPDTTFSEVRAMFLKAIELAEAEETGV